MLLNVEQFPLPAVKSFLSRLVFNPLSLSSSLFHFHHPTTHLSQRRLHFSHTHPKKMTTSDSVLFNFSKVSSRDALAFGAARPGYPDKKVTLDKVTTWATYMKSQGIKRVLSLLSDDEKADFYPDLDIDSVMTSEFGRGNYTRTSVFKPESREKTSAALRAAREAGESIVMHCSGGGGRATTAMGLWLVDGYGLAPEDAAREVQEEAEKLEGIKRNMNSAKLAYFVLNGTMIGFK